MLVDISWNIQLFIFYYRFYYMDYCVLGTIVHIYNSLVVYHCLYIHHGSMLYLAAIPTNSATKHNIFFNT